MVAPWILVTIVAILVLLIGVVLVFGKKGKMQKHLDARKLDQFLKDAREVSRNVIGRRVRIALEFRHKSWFTDEVIRILKKHGAALVFSHGSTIPYPSKEIITADFIYVRLHGPTKLYGSEYGMKRLKKWSKNVKRWTKRVKDVYVYFDNDQQGFAPKDAKRLLRLLR